MTLQFLADVVIAPYYAETGTVAEIDLRINQAFRTIKATLGDIHKLTFRVKVALGGYKLFRGKFVEAEGILSQAIESQRSVLRENDPLVLEAMTTLARVYGNISKFDQAERLARRVLELRQSLLGPNHALTVSTEILLALIYRERGDFPNADKIHTRLLDLLAAGGLVQTREIGTTLLALVHHYRRQKDWVKVDELADAVLMASRKQIKDENVSFQLIGINHERARSLMAQGRYPEAEPHFRRAVEVRIQRNSNHGRQFVAMSGLGECLFKQNKDFGQAEFLLKKACNELELRLNQVPENVRLEVLGGSLLRLTEFYEGTGRPAEAKVYRQKLAELENSEGRPLLSRDPIPIF
jgi:tetratricopeptide (TPR) repeat protein